MVNDFGRSMTEGTAAIFVGAGLSMEADMPSWGELLKTFQVSLGVPDLTDMPLLAEYIIRDPRFGVDTLKNHILTELGKVEAEPTDGHRSIARFPVAEVWTTNYDRLIELASPEANVVANDEAVATVGTSQRTVIKMHGSVAAKGGWESDPVISRSDYEMYETTHPRTWALLKASYYSRTFLFLGFSFTDPNIDLMLRLARVSGLAASSRHIAVLKRPDEMKLQETRLHDLRMLDFQRSGIRVHEIDGYDELSPLLGALVRRTRPPRMFISGSAGANDKTTIEPICKALASNLVSHPNWELTSLGGPAGWFVTRDVARIRRSEASYDPTKLTFYFQTKDDPAPPLDERVGTSIYTEYKREPLVGSILDECRAFVVVHGGTRTTQEIEWAQSRGVGIVPLAASGGAALTKWQEHTSNGSIPDLGGLPVDPAVWARLNDADMTVAARAAVKLLRQAMFEPAS